MNLKREIEDSSILIIDDNVRNLQVLGAFLKNEGLSVEFARDGSSSLTWLNKKKFDLVLLDIMMPGMDGYEVCSIIKNDPALCEIPIIFITAQTDSESIIRGFETGAVDYITKPFIQSELLIRVRTQLNIKKANERISHYMHQIEERNRAISDSIEYASYIQSSIISSSENNLKYLPEHFILFLPKDILSGDFYWLREADNKFIIAIMDCTGHGVPGALMSILGTTLLNEIVLHDHILQPDKILESLRHKIIQALGQKKGIVNIKDGAEGSVISFDPVLKKLQYSGSYNPLILINADEIIEIKAARVPIGYYELNREFTLHEIDIEKNDTIYLFSDGIIDQFGGAKTKRFMLKHLKEILHINRNKPMVLQKEILIEELNRWKGDLVQTDDILVLGIRF